MSSFKTEEEQVEDLKKWWKENGKSVIGGAVLGLAVVGGWQGWQQYTRQQAETASAYYEGFSQAVFTEQKEAAYSQGGKLAEKFPDSTYSMLAALQVAKMKYEEGDTTGAQLQLRVVMDKATDVALQEIARLRLVRLLLDGEKLDEAEKLVGQASLEAYAGEFSLLSGDIARSRGDMEKAREAYSKAMAQGVADQNLLKMKLAAVGGSKG